MVVDRVVLLGPGGAGKTTLAHRIGAITGAQVVCLDAIWKPNGTDRNLDEFRGMVIDAHAGDRWISDGNFAVATFDIRLPRATLIIWLEPSKWTCVTRATRRVFKRHEPHRIGGLLKVIQFILRFDAVNRPRIVEQRRAHGPWVPVLRLKTGKEVEAFLSGLG